MRSLSAIGSVLFHSIHECSNPAVRSAATRCSSSGSPDGKAAQVASPTRAALSVDRVVAFVIYSETVTAMS